MLERSAVKAGNINTNTHRCEELVLSLVHARAARGLAGWAHDGWASHFVERAILTLLIQFRFLTRLIFMLAGSMAKIYLRLVWAQHDAWLHKRPSYIGILFEVDTITPNCLWG